MMGHQWLQFKRLLEKKLEAKEKFMISSSSLQKLMKSTPPVDAIPCTYML